ncbi:sperm acrosome membrane-associated protein 4-like [Oryzias latipes]|uniref:sperm acrosome membrane-associated protein 4-like n=1 Tax=Oryzias latipes TaxID=8090 RepID=UPI0000E9C268|nr:sperm acrosome membrane-associated protein 4-like [Oryzias latipes]
MNCWRSLILLVVVIAAASSLTCRQCSIDIFGSCFSQKNVNCSDTTDQCYFGKTKFDSTDKVALYTRGCVNSFLCNATLAGTLLGAGYTAVYSCCTADLCNGATSVQLPLMAALLSGLLSSLWGFWQL